MTQRLALLGHGQVCTVLHVVGRGWGATLVCAVVYMSHMTVEAVRHLATCTVISVRIKERRVYLRSLFGKIHDVTIGYVENDIYTEVAKVYVAELELG